MTTATRTGHAALAATLGVDVRRGLPCPAPDGTVLRTDVYRPAGAGPFPVILQRTPYDRRHGQSNVGYAHPAWLAAQGYLVAVQDCRGRFGSEGTFTPFVDEAADSVAAIEWAAELDGSDGRVVTYGFSYCGWLQLVAAARRPAGLVAICPGFTSPEIDEGWTYTGGALRQAFVCTWANLLALEDARRAGDHAAVAELEAGLRGTPEHLWTLPVADYPPLRAGYGGYLHDWIAHPSGDPWWRPLSVAGEWDRVAVPALHVTGWYDLFLDGTVRSFRHLRRLAGTPGARDGQRLVIGPWVHGPWAPHGAGGGLAPGSGAVDDAHLAFLREVLGDGRSTAPVRVFVVNEGWRELSDWPPPAARSEPWFLHSGGRAAGGWGDGVLDRAPAGTEPADVLTYDPSVPVMSAGGHAGCVPGLTPMGPGPQAGLEAQKNVLVYTSPPLAEDLVLIGDVAVRLFAATDAPDTDWTARLCVVDPAGGSTNLQEGIVRASHALRRPPRDGGIEAYEIPLGPVGVRIPAGHRLRLDVASSDFPQWSRHLNTAGRPELGRAADGAVATQVVAHDATRPSCVILPVVPED